MLNVRIDSLSSDRQIAAKGRLRSLNNVQRHHLTFSDCRQCTKRRIKCDRSTPHCRKCTIRRFQCPGYDSVQLKWAHKRAVKRQFSSTLSTQRLDDQSQPAASTHEPQIPESTQNPDGQLPTTPHLYLQALLQDPVADRCLLDGYTWTILSGTLFTHFNNQVTPRLTWVDRPDHPWRTVISPLAKDNTCLRLSVLSLAAAHLSVTSPSSLIADKARAINRRLRDSSLHILNRKIGLELAGYSSAIHHAYQQSKLIEIMATTLVLCYEEMMVPNSTDWNLHLRACRTLIERYRWCNMPGEQSDVIDFVVKEVADIEVLRNIGAFTKDQVFMADTLRPQSSLENYFKTFMGVFREITTEERRRQALVKKGQPLPVVDMAVWLTKAEYAYTRASVDTAWLFTTHEDGTRKRMESTIRAVYYAICIYSHQALAPNGDTKEEIEKSISFLENEIKFLTAGSAHMFSHDIFVPLFILGTECWGDKSKQDEVEKQFVHLLSSTGIWCNSTALHFLKCFWATPEFHGTGKWIQYARENEKHNGPFLVF